MMSRSTAKAVCGPPAPAPMKLTGPVEPYLRDEPA